MNRSVLCLVFVSVLSVLSPGSVFSQDWRFETTIPMQGYVVVFVSTTPTGDVVATTFNSNKNREANLPVILIHKPLSAQPSYHVVCQNTFPAFRGYSGIAVDKEGNYYVAADTGDGATSWIRKFSPSGKQDMAFGEGGQIAAGKRFVGLDIFDTYLFTTAAFAELMVFDTRTGKLVGKGPAVTQNAPGTPAIRDIAVDPSKQLVYGVAAGAAWVWEGGTFDNPATYKLRRLSPDTAGVRAGEGVYFDPVSRKVLIPENETGNLLSVGEGATFSQSNVVKPSPTENQICDVVLLQDGKTLFITDLRRSQIYVMKRSEGDTLPVLPGTVAVADATPTAAAPPASSTGAGGVTWVNEYKVALRQSRDQNKPLIVFFRAPSVNLCNELEAGYLTSPEFANLASQAIVCRFDVSSDRLLAQQLGVFKVPELAIYSSKGDRLTRTSGKIDPAKVTAEFQAAISKAK
ncbi:MAG: thioredoxin family protein [Candidatus Sumerlaeaceae bacterium]|nr:thioredoxin family protein [Candidatus Sumerlaeaceae bacterium]